VDKKEVFEQLKKCSGLNEATHRLNDSRARSVPVAVLLVFAVLLSASSGVYAGASFFPQQSPNVTVTATIYSTTTSWSTSTIWSTVTQVVQGVLTSATYTTTTSTVTVTAATSSAPTIVGTSVTISQLASVSGRVTVYGVLRDANGKGLQGLQLRVTVDGGFTGRIITGVGGSFAYVGSGPTAKGQHVVTVWFDKTTQYSASSSSRTYSL
jgi:hypothetical protein